MQLLVNLHDDELRWWSHTSRPALCRLRGAALGGAYETAFTIDTAQQRRITGVQFAPGGAAIFFSGSMRAFCNRHVELADLPGWRDAREMLLEAKDPAGVLAVWGRLLRAQWRSTDLGFVRARDQLASGRSVREVAQAMSMSPRTLRQVFGDATGLSPKRFASIQRLKRLTLSVASRGDVDWARLADQCGYFDQAHMNRDFRKLTGLTPTSYAAGRLAESNHVAEPHAEITIDFSVSYNTPRRRQS